MSKIDDGGGAQATNTTCAGCGAPFVCGAISGSERCWCMDMPAVALEQTDTVGCFCPACLQRRLTTAPSPAAPAA